MAQEENYTKSVSEVQVIQIEHNLPLTRNYPTSVVFPMKWNGFY